MVLHVEPDHPTTVVARNAKKLPHVLRAEVAVHVHSELRELHGDRRIEPLDLREALGEYPAILVRDRARQPRVRDTLTKKVEGDAKTRRMAFGYNVYGLGERLPRNEASHEPVIDSS